MLRSLYSSISGLREHQIRMDTIGNNIANVNTIGYKGERVTFEESMAQMIEGPKRPADGTGGTNPEQVGLGVNLGSIDGNFSQGNLQATGKITDLAIEGNAFFTVSNGSGNFYTRNGAFNFDSDGMVTMPGTGYILQGKMADPAGAFPPGTTVGNIRIPFNDQSPAKATTDVDFSRNLDADSGAKGSILYTQRFLNNAHAGDSALGLSDGNGNALGLEPGDTMTFSALNPSTGAQAISTLTVTSTTTLQDITTAMQNFLQDPAGAGAAGATVDAVTLADDIANGTNQRGALTIYGNGAAIQNFQVTTNRPISNPLVAKAFSVPSTIPANAPKFSVITDTLRSPAVATDRVAELFDANGHDLGLEAGDAISFRGDLGGKPANNVTDLIYNPGTAAPASGTTMQDILDKIKDNFKLPQTDGTVDNNPSVALNMAGTTDNIPDGSIVIRGMPEKAFGINAVEILASNSNNQVPAPTFFNSNVTATKLRDATDTGVFDTSITTYDELGKEHTVTMKFTNSGQPNQWLWEASLGGQEQVLQGQRGTLTFGQDGTVSSFVSTDNSSILVFDPKNGASAMRVRLNVGAPGDFKGLTQFSSPTTAAATGQDGYGMGRLREIAIDENGLINGSFTNGVSKTLAQIMLTDFTNPGGLLRMKDSVYAESSNSGTPVLGAPGTQSASVIKPGSLELSNVELAEEFTDMITTQRGYQANARVITVSDQLLEELVSLKR